MKARKVKGLDPAGGLAANAARIVRVRLDELRSFAPGALDAGATREQHDMRIAAKRLRYVLEATEFCFDEGVERARKRARDLQQLLGELHDCDVMLPRVRDHQARLRAADARAVRAEADGAPDLAPSLVGNAPNRAAYRGLELLSVHLEARRQLLLDRFRAFWVEQEAAGVWAGLERATHPR